jgi:hypothetical protein
VPPVAACLPSPTLSARGEGVLVGDSRRALSPAEALETIARIHCVEKPNSEQDNFVQNLAVRCRLKLVARKNDGLPDYGANHV